MRRLSPRSRDVGEWSRAARMSDRVRPLPRLDSHAFPGGHGLKVKLTSRLLVLWKLMRVFS